MKKLIYACMFCSVIAFTCNAGGTEKSAKNDIKSTSIEADKDIVSLAVETDILSTLVAAVKAGGLVETLQGDGPFTVFAPTNDAFAALPEGTLESLLKPENKDKLVAILTYHVVSGKVMSSDLKEGMKAKTVNGKEITISLKGGAKVNDASVVKADIEASNGVVHVIDAVILP
ncbi:MAG: fasciclin domain-containing protein [Bacteroidota bacterium]